MINTPAFEALLSRERGFSQYTSNSNTVVSSSGSSELRRQAWIQSLCLHHLLLSSSKFLILVCSMKEALYYLKGLLGPLKRNVIGILH